MKYDVNGALLQSKIEELPPPRRGKVRDIYDMGDSLLFVASDRISAFDHILPNGIPNKGRVLTQLSLFWFAKYHHIPNHFITANVEEYPSILSPYKQDLAGRSMLVKKADPLPVECVCRGYLIGSGWKDYQESGTVCGIKLREGYQLAEKLDEPLFTPAFKAQQGDHDENITFDKVISLVGKDVAVHLKETSLKLYSQAAEYALKKGIIIADTKFEFGIFQEDILLIDEVLTPDSSRFWPDEQYRCGKNPPNLDKQFVRDYLNSIQWNKTPPVPFLPKDVVVKTSERYKEALDVLVKDWE